MTGVTSARYLAELTGMSRRHALRRAHECLHYAGLSEALYRPCEEYSTGMRQRLKLAQALVHDPEVLFLDEPVSGMDPAGRDEFLGLIRSLARDHRKHVVWSSHMLPDVQKVADAVLVLDRGRLRGSFRLEDLAGATDRLRVEGTGDVEGFDRELGRRGLTAEAVPVASGLPETEAGRFVRVVRGVVGGPGAVLAAALAADVAVRSLSPVVERLEDVFDRLIGVGDDSAAATGSRT
jgi:ABC-2 type transport system ATP-binding protein